jgi:hopanoid biosynthesis associated protein HpnK
MARPESPRRLIVNADDFGRSSSINQAVIRAHREGILTTASLMVNEPACEEAVALARECPRLGVGLHISLLCGKSGLPPSEIPGLVDADGNFSSSPVGAGMKYFFHPQLQRQLELELGEQFARFRQTGLALDHVNGHLHLHLHPTVLGLLLKNDREWGIARLRLTRDPFRLNARIARGAWIYRATHAAIYAALSSIARPKLKQRGIRFAPAVFGLLQNARVDEQFMLSLLPCLPEGESELYSHPSLDEFKNEFDALISPSVKELVAQQGIDLIRYQDL